MSIIRKELKAGDKYKWTKESYKQEIFEIKYVSKTYALIEYSDGVEFCTSHRHIMDEANNAPKPKKKIKVVKFMDDEEDIWECTIERFLKRYNNFKKLLEYEVEVEDV